MQHEQHNQCFLFKHHASVLAYAPTTRRTIMAPKRELADRSIGSLLKTIITQGRPIDELKQDAELCAFAYLAPDGWKITLIHKECVISRRARIDEIPYLEQFLAGEYTHHVH